MRWFPSKVSEKRTNVDPEEDNFSGKEEKNSEKITKDPDKPSSRFDGTNAQRETYQKETPGQSSSSRLDTVKSVVKKRNK